MKKIRLIILICFLNGTILNGQNNFFTDIKTGGLTNIKPIMVDNNVNGYFCIYPLEKSGKNTYDYELNILDNNLKETHTLIIPSTKSAELIDAAFNGERFCFTFYDNKNKDHFIEHVIVNQDATIDTILPKKVKNFTYSALEDKTLLGVKKYIYPVGDIGFAWLNNPDLNNSVIEVFDIKGNILWTSAEFNDEKRIKEEIKILYSDSAMVLAMVNINSTDLTGSVKKINSFFVGFNAADGKIIVKKEMTSSKYGLDLQNAFFNPESKDFVLMGEYFELSSSGKTNTNSKLGIFSYKIDDSGDLTEYYNSWENDFSKKITINSKNKMENNSRVYFHSAVHVGSSFYFIGEQFKGGYDPYDNASVITSFAMGAVAGVSSYPVDLYNIVTVKLTDEFKIDSVQIIEKPATHFSVPSNPMSTQSSVSYMSDHLLFNYRFTTLSKNNFSSVFINFDKKKKSGEYYNVYVLSLNSDSNVSVNRIKIENNPEFFTVLPAKPGYVAIYESSKNGKETNFRLEKLDN